MYDLPYWLECLCLLLQGLSKLFKCRLEQVDDNMNDRLHCVPELSKLHYEIDEHRTDINCHHLHECSELSPAIIERLLYLRPALDVATGFGGGFRDGGDGVIDIFRIFAGQHQRHIQARGVASYAA